MAPPSPARPFHAADRAYDESPLIVTWELTRACALRCAHCRADATTDRHPDELTTAEGRELLEDVKGFGRPPPVVVFSGGDPLARDDVMDLLAYSRSIGLPTAITPAPTPRLDADTVEAFADLGVHRMAVSLDGASPAAHDGFRGEDGSFEVVMRAAERARRLELPLQINTTVTARTAPELPAIARLVEDLGAVMWEVFFLVPIGRGATLAQLTPERAEHLLAWLYRRQRGASFRLITVEAPHYRRVAEQRARATGERHTRVGSTGDGNGFVFVSHVGEIHPSGFMPISAGNVRRRDLVSTYRESPLFRLLRDPEALHGPCGSCAYRAVCGGSRARAYATTGSPFGTDPLCLHATRLADA